MAQPRDGQFILSVKSEEEFAAAAEFSTRLLLYGAIGLSLIGAVLTLLAVLG